MTASGRVKLKDPVPQVVCWPGIPPVGLGSQFESLKVNDWEKGFHSKITEPLPRFEIEPAIVIVFEPVNP